jgi:hypothetical protein
MVLGGWDGERALDLIEIFSFVPHPPFLLPVEGQQHLITARNRPAAVVVINQ